MKQKTKYWLPALSLGLGLFLFAPPAASLAAMGVVQQPTVIYVHGFNFGLRKADTIQCQGKAACRSYWGTQDESAHVVHVGYDGRKNPLRLHKERGVTRMLKVFEPALSVAIRKNPVASSIIRWAA